MASKQQLDERIEGFKRQKLSLDMTRGKPGTEQLDICSDMLTVVDEHNYRTPSGLDVRNYGGLDGFPEAKKLFAEFLEVATEEVIIGGNASLNLMYDTVAQCMTHGTSGGGKPWYGQKSKFLCPVPGYDRHFAICEYFGIEMIPVALTDSGPPMDEVEALVRQDPAIRGMWCVPKYSNPTGAVYSDDTVERLASMKTAAADFRILWDNAYTVHHLGGGPARLKNILEACKQAGNAERVLIFGSTSKVSFPGAGIALMGGSAGNMEWLRSRLFFQTIGPDKINMLRHVLYFGDMQGILDHMDKHARIIAPKFQAVQEILERELGGKGLAGWTRPQGGYFVSLETQPGKAAAVIALAGELGVKFTKAGATWPYGKDPQDSNIRIAPTLPSLEQIRTAVEVLAVCIQSVGLGGGA
ncbi:MAG: aminotransferase class I/II-fold pyridoxal phosphate-dependent enzyme [Spirochaetaceae bacterium]|nr:MAG: aminotransferase class I/II-fold pyridoxal phosphate-dependent enzyme [Spirochaetaceae bacterium]